jgi:methionine-S-sulfoxide reductase
MKMDSIVLGSGCFWCIEAVFQRVKGVINVVSGYAGGGTEVQPNYNSIHSPQHNHAEVIQVTYDPQIIELSTLLKIFFGTHDPTTNQQPGTADKGSEYRSIILCKQEELVIAEQAKQQEK